MLGQELHLNLSAIHLEQCANPAQSRRIRALGVLPVEHVQVVPEDVVFALLDEPFAVTAFHSPLDSGDSNDPAFAKIGKMLEIDISLSDTAVSPSFSPALSRRPVCFVVVCRLVPMVARSVHAVGN